MHLFFSHLQKIKTGHQCFILHDVDLVPLNAQNLYACSKLPLHLLANIDMFRFNLPYKNLFGVCNSRHGVWGHTISTLDPSIFLRRILWLGLFESTKHRYLAYYILQLLLKSWPKCIFFALSTHNMNYAHNL